MFNDIIDRKKTNCAKWDESIENTKIEDVIPLTVADMDFRTSPEIIESMINAANHGVYGYTNISDDYINNSLEWIKDNYYWNPNKEYLVYCPRIIQAISLIIQNFTSVDDRIMISTPLYSPIQSSIEDNGRIIVDNKLKIVDNHYEIDFKDFENKISSGVKIYICVSPHNPTGRVWTKEELDRIINICKRHNVLIISDEVHADFVWENKFISFGSFYNQYDNMIICTSPSKTFNIPGLEASNIIIKNKKIRNEFIGILKKSGIHNPNYFCVKAVETAYSKSEEWLSLLKYYIKDNINYIKNEFDDLEGFKVTKSEGTFLLWIDYRKLNISENEMRILMYESKVLFNLGSEFGDEGIGFFRINIASPRKLLVNALERFKSELKK